VDGRLRHGVQGGGGGTGAYGGAWTGSCAGRLEVIEVDTPPTPGVRRTQGKSDPATQSRRPGPVLSGRATGAPSLATAMSRPIPGPLLVAQAFSPRRASAAIHQMRQLSYPPRSAPVPPERPVDQAFISEAAAMRPEGLGRHCSLRRQGGPGQSGRRVLDLEDRDSGLDEARRTGEATAPEMLELFVSASTRPPLCSSPPATTHERLRSEAALGPSVRRGGPSKLPRARSPANRLDRGGDVTPTRPCGRIVMTGYRMGPGIAANTWTPVGRRRVGPSAKVIRILKPMSPVRCSRHLPRG